MGSCGLNAGVLSVRVLLFLTKRCSRGVLCDVFSALRTAFQIIPTDQGV